MRLGDQGAAQTQRERERDPAGGQNQANSKRRGRKKGAQLEEERDGSGDGDRQMGRERERNKKEAATERRGARRGPGTAGGRASTAAELRALPPRPDPPSTRRLWLGHASPSRALLAAETPTKKWKPRASLGTAQGATVPPGHPVPRPHPHPQPQRPEGLGGGVSAPFPGQLDGPG